MMGARQAEMLRKLLNFSFVRHPLVPEERVAATEKHLRKRASQLLGLSRTRAKATEPDFLERLERNKARADEANANNPSPPTDKSKEDLEH
jgi:hypothetical protein